MTIERVDGLAVLTCDECEQTQLGPVSDDCVEDLRRQAEREGWRRLDSNGTNICPKCALAFADADCEEL